MKLLCWLLLCLVGIALGGVIAFGYAVVLGAYLFNKIQPRRRGRR